MCILRGVGRTLKEIFKVPSTRGGKIRLLGLLAYSVASTISPPLGVAVKAILLGVGSAAGIQ